MIPEELRQTTELPAYYTLTCEKCGQAFQSQDAFPDVQLCANCARLPKLRMSGGQVQKEQVTEAMFEVVDSANFKGDCASEEAVDKLLSLTYPNGQPMLAVLAENQELPEIPEFQYDDEEYIPYLQRGAINYSKLLAGWRRCL